MTTWGKASEAYIYIGILPWFIALIGMIAGRDGMKRVWLLILIGTGLLMLGPPGGLHRFMYFLYPPLWFMRHTHTLVLFFIFALLYFYILGLNHIISSVRNNLLPEKECKHRHKVLSVTLLTGCIIASIYWMALATLYEHLTNYQLFFLIPAVISGWLIYRIYGKKSLFTSLTISHIVLVMLLSFNNIFFLAYTTLFSAPAIIVFVILKKNRLPLKQGHQYLSALLILVFGISLIGDLIYAFKHSDLLYQSQRHPGRSLNISTGPLKPVLPQPRGISPPPFISSTGQSIRYLSLLLRRPFVFSPVYKGEGDIDSFKDALEKKRWNSFLMLRSYFELINSGIPAPVLEEIFAVGSPVFQFRRGFIPSQDDQIISLLKEDETKEVRNLLKRYVFLDKEGTPAHYGKMVSWIDLENAPEPRTEETNGFHYRIKDYEYDSFTVEISANEKGILYWADGFDRWWKAYRDGVEVPIYRANINFKAVGIPAGLTNIRFVYNPRPFVASLVVFYGTFIVSVVSAIITVVINHMKPT